MLTLYAYDDGKLTKWDSLDEISDLISDQTITVWLDAIDPSADELELLGEEFGFHQLAIDDYSLPHARPKLDEYDGYFFIVTQSLDYCEADCEITFRDLDIFIGRNYIVTLHRGKLDVLDKVVHKWQQNPRLLDDGTGMLLYDILDGLVDSYFPVLDEIDDRIDKLEDTVFAQGTETSAQQIFKLKRTLLLLRRVCTPMRDVFNDLVRRDQSLISEQAMRYLRDVYDHSLRIVDTIDTFRDILASALEAYLSTVSNQLNSVMKTLTVVTTVLISSQIISGIYGMNFKYMPELNWRYSYPSAIGLMVAVALGLLYYFKRIKWL